MFDALIFLRWTSLHIGPLGERYVVLATAIRAQITAGGVRGLGINVTYKERSKWIPFNALTTRTIVVADSAVQEMIYTVNAYYGPAYTNAPELRRFLLTHC